MLRVASPIYLRCARLREKADDATTIPITLTPDERAFTPLDFRVTHELARALSMGHFSAYFYAMLNLL